MDIFFYTPSPDKWLRIWFRRNRRCHYHHRKLSNTCSSCFYYKLDGYYSCVKHYINPYCYEHRDCFVSNCVQLSLFDT